MPTVERISHLIEATDIVHEAIENDATMDRKMAGALWVIGVEANIFSKDRTADETDALISLFTAVESALVGFWPVGHPRDKEGVANGE